MNVAPATRSLGARVSGLLPQRSDWAAARRAPRADLLAGLTVAVVALPLALAFGVTSGMGAQAGLVTAVVAGAVAAVFGGSNLQVSGPTGAMTVVLVPVIAQFGTTGVLMVGAMAGVILIGLAAARLGRYVRYLPTPPIRAVPTHSGDRGFHRRHRRGHRVAAAAGRPRSARRTR